MVSIPKDLRVILPEREAELGPQPENSRISPAPARESFGSNHVRGHAERRRCCSNATDGGAGHQSDRPCKDLQMQSFISRTAWVKPTKTARLTMLWPMLSSAMWSIAAIGPTFR